MFASSPADKDIGVVSGAGSTALLRRFAVSRRSSFEVQLCSADRKVLEVRASSRSAPHAEVVRARIVLLAAHDTRNIDIYLSDPTAWAVDGYTDELTRGTTSRPPNHGSQRSH